MKRKRLLSYVKISLVSVILPFLFRIYVLIMYLLLKLTLRPLILCCPLPLLLLCLVIVHSHLVTPLQPFLITTLIHLHHSATCPPPLSIPFLPHARPHHRLHDQMLDISLAIKFHYRVPNRFLTSLPPSAETSST